MSAALTASIESLDAVLFETGLLMQSVVQQSVAAPEEFEHRCAALLAEVHQQATQVAAAAPGPHWPGMRRLAARKSNLSALEFVVRRVSHEMTQTLNSLQEKPDAGGYSPKSTRTATAGAWMNVRSSP